MVGLIQRQVDVGVDAVGVQQLHLRPDQGVVALGGGKPAGGLLGLAQRDRVLGERQALHHLAVAADRGANSPRPASTPAIPASAGR